MIGIVKWKVNESC